MIYDCFPFFNELDLLEIRLAELSNVVDRFVLVEAELTHNGDSKPLYFSDNKGRFSRFLDKIIHIVVREDEFLPARSGETFQERAWMRENIQRNAIVRGLVAAEDDDVLIVSDLDEIPRAEKIMVIIRESLEKGYVANLKLNAYNYYINLRNVSAPVCNNGPKIARVETFRDKEYYTMLPYSHFVLQAINQGPTPTRFRFIEPSHDISNAGWHFTYLGGIESAVKKLRAFNEVGLYNKKDLAEFVQRKIATGRALFGNDRFMPELLDESFPAYVLANRERFVNLIYEPIPRQGIKVRFLRKWYYTIACVRRSVMRMLFWFTPKWVRAIIKRLMGMEP